MKIKLIATVTGLLLSFGCMQAQGVHKNMIRTMGTFALGTNFNEFKYHVYGDAGFMASDMIEINGAIYANLGSSAKDQDRVSVSGTPTNGLEDYQAHSLFFGPRFHFLPERSFDLYAGIQPGVSLVHTQSVFMGGGSGSTLLEPAHYGMAPVFSVAGGLGYYASFFHLFGEARFVAGHYYDQAYSIPLNELRLAFGLGFNIN